MFEWDGELVNKPFFGPFVYWFGQIYRNFSAIAGMLFAVFTIQSLVSQLSGGQDGSKKVKK